MGKMNNLKKKRLMRRNMVGYSFIAPNFIGFAVFTMMPMLFSFGLSFCDFLLPICGDTGCNLRCLESVV